MKFETKVWWVAFALAACVDGGGGGTDSGTTNEDARTAGDASSAGADVGLASEASTGDDADGDGVPVPADCDDTNAAVHPGAMEDCATPIDEDCDGDATMTDPDCDGDVDEDVDEDSDEDSDDDVDEDSDEDSDESPYLLIDARLDHDGGTR